MRKFADEALYLLFNVIGVILLSIVFVLYSIGVGVFALYRKIRGLDI